MASISATTFGNVSCAGGEGDYNRCGLYIHGVEYARQDGSSVAGTYLAVSLGDVADPILSGPDELGMGRVHCHIDVTRKADSYRLVASWGGFQFLDLGVDSLAADDPDTGEAAGAVGGEEEDFDILTYRYVPAVGQPGKADVAYACVVPRARVPKVNSVQTLYGCNNRVRRRGLGDPANPAPCSVRASRDADLRHRGCEGSRGFRGSGRGYLPADRVMALALYSVAMEGI